MNEDLARAAAARARIVRELQALLVQDPLFSPLPELILERQRQLGEGGMGVVQLVIDRRLGRMAALKTIKGEGEDRRVRRFLREATVTARLDHPGIPPVYEAGRTANGQHFMLLRFVDGQSLTARIRAHAPVRELVGILVKVSEAVAYAHSRKIVHRDLKPDNIMVGAFGEVLVMDWGLARDLSESRSADAAVLDRQDDPAGEGLTTEGSLLGTLGYVPAEQARGEDVDDRADIFALGAMLCEVLTGRPPVQSASRLEAIQKTLDGEIRRPREIDASVPPELDAVAAKALAFSPDDRYASATRFAAELRAWLEGQPVSVFRYGRARRLARLARQHPTEVASIGGALVLALAAAGLFALQNVEIRRSRDAVEAKSGELARTLSALEKETRERHAAEDERSAVERSRALLAEGRTRFRQGATHDVVKRLVDEAVALRRTEAVLLEAGRLLADVGEDEAARRLLRAAADEFLPGYAALFALHELDLARSAGAGMVFSPPLRELATRARARGEENEFTDLASALELALRESWPAALEHCDRAVAKAPRFSYAWAFRAEIRFLARDDAGALVDAEKAVELDATSFVALHQRGLVKWRRRDLAGAMADLDHAIHLAPRAAQVFCDRAIVHRDRNELDLAIADLGRAVELAPDAAIPWLNRSAMWLRKGDLERAQADNDQALAIDPKKALVWSNRGSILIRRRDVKGARAAIDKALELSPDHVPAWVCRAILRRSEGDDEGALADLTRALELDPSESQPWAIRGEIRSARGDLEGALADESRAIELAPCSSDAWAVRAYARSLQHDLSGAREDYDKAIALDPRNPGPLINRAVLRCSAGETEAALVDIDRSLAVDRTATALGIRGLIHVRMCDFFAGRADFLAAIALAPEKPGFEVDLAIASYEAGDFDACVRKCSEVITRVPRCALAWHERSYGRLRNGDKDGALADVEQALTLEAPSAGTFATLALILTERKDLERAAEAIAKGDMLDPLCTDLFVARAHLHLARGELAEVVRNATRALAADVRWDTYELRATARLARGERTLAREDLEAAARLIWVKHPRRPELEKRIAELSR